MARIYCRVKIKNAYVTKTALSYDGSLGLGKKVIEDADMFPGEAILVANVNNAQRFTTYVIEEKNPRDVCVYGAAAKLVNKGDQLIIMAFDVGDKPRKGAKLPKVIDLAKYK